MKRIFLYVLGMIALVHLQAQTPTPSLQAIAKYFENAYKTGEPLPPVKKIYPEISLEEAYEVQGAWVTNSLSPEGIGGVKAGVVTPESQKTFGIDTPISGILREKGKIEAKKQAKIKLADYPDLVLETEIGFVIGKTLNKVPSSIEEFQTYVAEIVPVIELAAGVWDKPGGAPSPANYIAINLLATGYIIGEGLAPDQLDPMDISLRFSYEGEELHTAKGSDNWNGPWQTALWMTAYARQQGIALEPGDIIICGALGQVHPGEKGVYTYEASPFPGFRLKIK